MNSCENTAASFYQWSMGLVFLNKTCIGLEFFSLSFATCSVIIYYNASPTFG